jgi:hypothetical protein
MAASMCLATNSQVRGAGTGEREIMGLIRRMDWFKSYTTKIQSF